MRRLEHRLTRDDQSNRCIGLAFWFDFFSGILALTLAHNVWFRLVAMGTNELSQGSLALLVVFGALLNNLFILLTNGYRQRTLLRFRRSFTPICQSAGLWLFAIPAITLYLRVLPELSRGFIGLGFVLMILTVISGRYLFHRLIRALGYTVAFRQRVILVDWTPKIATMAEALTSDPWHPYEIVGVAPMQGDRFSNPPDMRYPVLGSYKELETVFERGLVQLAILGDGPLRTDESIASLSALCEKHLVTFMMIPKAFQILLGSLRVTTVSSIPVMGITELPLERPFNSTLKRITDLLGALVGLILFSPLIAFFCMMVYVESPGPVFYRQRRIGKGGREFEIIKIRSMRLDAEKESGARWATQDDPRRLRIGAFMRQWNIDELPQFWNVLKGEMSLVGPRPERPELIDGFKETIRNYNTRHHVIPGVTGWAQVNGLRGDTDLAERVRYDLYYMENWSLAMDFQIMLMTFFRWEGAA